MSEVSLTVCDYCDAETRDCYAKGWVTVEGHISFSNGRDKTKSAKTNWLGPNSKWNFCSLECLVLRLKTGKKEPR